MTKSKALEFCIDTLSKAGFGEANVDARLLMEYIAGVNRNDIILNPDMELDEDIWQKVKIAVEKRLRHIPLQHITGYQNFMGLEFMVNENVLIPRQDTETLVEEVLRLGQSGMDVLDICTGSGCILLSILKYSYDFRGVGIDISADALEVAKRNSSELGIQASFFQGDLFEAVPDGMEFDIIVSNPPYIRSDVIPTLMEEVKDHEPLIALDGMEDGLFFYRKIVQNAANYLRSGGNIFFEIGYDQGEDVSRLLREAGYADVHIIKDLAGLDRVVTGILLEKK